MRRLAVVCFAFAPLLVLLSIWLPVWLNYRVPDGAPVAATVARLRANPDDARLLALDEQARGLRAPVRADDVLRQAEAIERGRIELPTGETLGVTLPFDAREFDAGTPSS